MLKTAQSNEDIKDVVDFDIREQPKAMSEEDGELLERKSSSETNKEPTQGLNDSMQDEVEGHGTPGNGTGNMDLHSLQENSKDIKQLELTSFELDNEQPSNSEQRAIRQQALGRGPDLDHL